MGNVLPILIIIIFIAFSAFFSASETAFTSLNRIKIEADAKEGDKRAKLVSKLHSNYDALLSGILVGNNIVNIGASSLATVLFTQLNPDYGATISTAVMTIMVLIFGEIGPKTIANASAENTSRIVSPLLNLILTLLTPVTWLFQKLQTALVQKVSSGEPDKISDAELMAMVDEAESLGSLSAYEQKLISAAILFDDIRVSSIIVPRVEIIGFDVNSSIEVIQEVFQESKFSRLVVYDGSLDHVVGFVHESDFNRMLLNHLKDGTVLDIRSIMIEPEFVPATIRVSDLLKKMQKAQFHMAIVRDEYAGTKGMVTIEDILEELVGEIWDERDEIHPEFVQLSENEYRFSGQLALFKMFQILEKNHYNDEFISHTVGGFVIEQLEDFPKIGQEFRFENLLFQVEDLDDRQVSSVKVKILKAEV